MITKIEDITPLEITLQTENYHQVLSEYFGEDYWLSEFNEDEADIDDNQNSFAIYNDEIDESCQLGVVTLTFINNEIESIHILRKIL